MEPSDEEKIQEQNNIEYIVKIIKNLMMLLIIGIGYLFKGWPMAVALMVGFYMIKKHKK